MRPLKGLALVALALPSISWAQQSQNGQPPAPPIILTDAERQRIDAEAFSDALNSEFPLKDQERIRQTLEIQQQQQQMLRAMRNTQMISASQLVSLTPGAKSTMVPLAFGHATVISVIDQTGQPWPIRSNTAGEGVMISINDPLSSQANMIVVAPKVQYARTNLVLVLEGVDIPLMVTVEAVDGVAMDNVVLQVDRRGPLARAPEAFSAPRRADDDVMRALLDGALPVGAALIAATGADATAYRVGNRLFLRTQSTLRWPAPINILYGIDDVRLYEVPPQAQMVLASRRGEIQRLTVADTGLLLDTALAARTPAMAPGSILQPLMPQRTNPYTHVIGPPVDEPSQGMQLNDPRRPREQASAPPRSVRPAVDVSNGGMSTQPMRQPAQPANALPVTSGPQEGRQ